MHTREIIQSWCVQLRAAEASRRYLAILRLAPHVDKPGVVEALLPLTDDPQRLVRRLAFEVLVPCLSQHRVRDALLNVALRDPDCTLREETGSMLLQRRLLN